MADGMLCVHCGWQETEHNNPNFVGEEDATKCRLGKQISLRQCLDNETGFGFTPDDPVLAEKLAKKADEENHAQEMRKRKNGGIYS